VRILRKTQPWVTLVSNFGLVCAGLIGVTGAVTVTGMAGNRVERTHIAAWLLYPALVALYLVPSLQLRKYARRIDLFVAQGHTVQLEAALEAQRAFWRFAGIFVIASAGTAALVLAAAMIVGIVAGV
jgi:hypothetical protein